jgi:hypothetical protein
VAESTASKILSDSVEEPEDVAVVELPFKSAVIIFALKLPLASRETIASAVLELVAVVAEFATLPAVEIVASFVSEIFAVALISASTIAELTSPPSRLNEQPQWTSLKSLKCLQLHLETNLRQVR